MGGEEPARSKYGVENKTSSDWSRSRSVLWASCFHGAERDDDDQDHSAGGGCDQRSDLTQLGPPEFRLFPLQQRVITWRVNVLHPVLQIVGV